MNTPPNHLSSSFPPSPISASPTTSPSPSSSKSLPPFYPFSALLHKRRDYLAGYRPRLFILDPPLLHYFLKESDTSPKKSICITGCTIQSTGGGSDGGSEITNNNKRDSEADDSIISMSPDIDDSMMSVSSFGDDSTTTNEKNLYTFKITHNNNSSAKTSYYLGAATQEIRDLWVRALQAAAAAGRKQAIKTSVSLPSPPSPAPSPPSTSASTISSSQSSFSNIPPQHIPLIKTKLNLLQTTHSKTSNWSPLFQKDGITAETLPDPTGGPLLTIRASSLIKLHPYRILGTILSIDEKMKYDDQLDLGTKRIKTMNEHSFVDYFRFKGVWPTSVRDVLTLVYWTTLPKTSENAMGSILVVGFSVEDEAQPFTRGHVRAEVAIGGWVLIPRRDSVMNEVHTHTTFIVSTDLKGSLPSSIVNQITAKQANLPSILRDYIGKRDKVIADKIEDDAWFVSDEEIVSEVNSKLSPGLQLQLSRPLESVPASTVAVVTPPAIEPPIEMAPPTPTSISPITSPLLAIALFLPAILWSCSKHLSRGSIYDYRGLVFITVLILSLRFLTLRHLGPQVLYKNGSVPDFSSNGNAGTGEVQCNFRVDLKRVLMYIESKRKGASTDTDVAVTHIAMKAVAIALKENALFNGRRVCIPLLGIDGYYANKNVQVSTLAAGINGSKVVGAESISVLSIAETIADMHSRKVAQSWIPQFLRRPLDALSSKLDIDAPKFGMRGRAFGSAVIITSPPNNDMSDLELSVSSIPRSPTDPSPPNVYAVIGGVKVIPATTISKTGGRKEGGRPALSVSVTLDCAVCGVGACRVFAERVQELMGRPELMESV